METQAGPMGIAVCEPMVSQIKSDFAMTLKSNIKVKGFGDVDVFSLDGIISGSLRD
jgi:hypothetical protein